MALEYHPDCHGCEDQKREPKFFHAAPAALA
jgi:hypothetical protein